MSAVTIPKDFSAKLADEYGIKLPTPYIFEYLTETTARFRPITDQDDQELVIPLHELQDEREHKENMGWTFDHSDPTGQYYVCK